MEKKQPKNTNLKFILNKVNEKEINLVNNLVSSINSAMENGFSKIVIGGDYSNKIIGKTRATFYGNSNPQIFYFAGNIPEYIEKRKDTKIFYIQKY